MMAKLYWPIIGFFVVALLVNIISFFYTIENSAAGTYYNTNTLKMIAVIIGFTTGSIYMKQQGKIQLAYLLIYVPLALVILAVLLFFLIAFKLGQ